MYKLILVYACDSKLIGKSVDYLLTLLFDMKL